jgi:acetolactate synthase-1/2/3 large subunit
MRAARRSTKIAQGSACASAISKLFADFTAQGESEIWNIQISDKVTAPVIRQTIKRGHGNM